MHWKVRDNCISELFVNDENLILPWGIETADSSAFFSLQDGVGYRYKLLDHQLECSSTSYRQQCTVQMVEGAWELLLYDTIQSDHQIKRTATLTCLKDSYFMDFVMRFRFRNALFQSAKINHLKLSHQNSNIYYQHQVSETSLFGEKFTVNLQVTGSTCPKGMRPYMYVRDAPNEWVVHARMLPEQADKEVIKLCTDWAKTRPLPQWISRPILAMPGARNAMWYRGERKPYKNRIIRKFNPLCCPLIKVRKGNRLSWSTILCVSETNEK